MECNGGFSVVYPSSHIILKLLYVKSHWQLIWEWLETSRPVEVACNKVAKLKQRTVPILLRYPDMFSMIFLSCKTNASMYLQDRTQAAPLPSVKSANVTLYVWLSCSHFKPRHVWNQRSSLLKNILPFVAEVISVTTMRVSAKTGDPLVSAQSLLQVRFVCHSLLMCFILRDGKLTFVLVGYLLTLQLCRIHWHSHIWYLFINMLLQMLNVYLLYIPTHALFTL